jgi:hypothetical protein
MLERSLHKLRLVLRSGRAAAPLGAASTSLGRFFDPGGRPRRDLSADLGLEFTDALLRGFK